MTDREMLQEILNKVNCLDNKVTHLEEDVSGLKEDVSGLKEDVSGLKEDVSGLKEDVSGLKEKTSSIQMTLENETNRNIKIIAEGHLDLSRNLHDALKVNNEKEMLIIRVNSLEDDVRRIKEKLAM